MGHAGKFEFCILLLYVVFCSGENGRPHGGYNYLLCIYTVPCYIPYPTSCTYKYNKRGFASGGLTPALAPRMPVITEDVGKSRP